MKVLLISGHGASDCGAIGNGYKEADLTRELVNLIAPELKKYATVDIYPQNQNAYKDYKSGKFNVGKYDYALEVHFNAYNGKAKGSEIYVTTKEKGIKVEQAIMQNMKKYFTLRDNDSVFDGVKRENFSVIYSLKNKGISGSLLEVCFIDNANDMKVYQQYKKDIAIDIVLGIVSGFGLNKKEEPKEEPKQDTDVLELQKAINKDLKPKPLLAEDNKLGQKTMAQMKKVLVKKPSVGNFKTYPNVIKFVQKKVGTTVDGVYGKDSVEKVKAYQKKHNLKQDGIVGYNTLYAMVTK